MNYGEALNIWKQNGLKLPELPLDECIFPNAQKLLQIETIYSKLLEACKQGLIWIKASEPDYQHGSPLIKQLEQAINRAEGRE